MADINFGFSLIIYITVIFPVVGLHQKSIVAVLLWFLEYHF